MSVGKDTNSDLLQLHWKGSYQVLLINPCAAKLQDIDSWIQLSHLKKAQTPKEDWTSEHISETRLCLTKSSPGQEADVSPRVVDNLKNKETDT